MAEEKKKKTICVDCNVNQVSSEGEKCMLCKERECRTASGNQKVGY